jgi:hypothetical protein
MRLQQRGAVDLAVRLHPHIGAAAAALHRGDLRIRAREPRKPAGQHTPRLRTVAHREHAQQHRARRDVAGAQVARPRGHLRQRQVALHGVGIALAHDAAGPLVQLAPAELAAEHCVETRLAVEAGVGGLDGAVAQLRQHGFERGALAAPPGGESRELELLADQPSRKAGQEAEQRGRFEERRARHVGHQHVAGANRLQQAGHAERGIGAQLQRVEELVVQPLDEAVHRAQALQRLEVQALVAHREVAALDQRHAEIPREVRVLEVGLVVRAGREEGDVGRNAGRAHALQAVHHGAVGGGQALHVQRLEGLRKLPRDGQAVLQQVAQARGRLGALRHHPPVAVGAAREVEGRDVQPGVARRLHAVQRAQVARMAAHQRRRQEAFAQQLLRAVHVGHHAVEHAHALQHAGLDLAPALGRDDQREQVERPGALRAVGVGVDVVGDAVVADLPLQADRAARQVVEAAGPSWSKKAFQAGVSGGLSLDDACCCDCDCDWDCD